ncbi:MAG TPA: class I SAM-dependent methyltransferase [Candidatus Nitrosotenuis sp.]|nr:class I SAM-dependent methyltransferase [Candidatus Nitrosotenuis sp.]
MSILDKMRGNERSAAAPAVAPANLRVSNGLKDFLWLISDVERGQLLDLGPISQHTVSLFTERGFKVYAEDVLRAWEQHLRAAEERLRRAPAGTTEALDPETMAAKFLDENLQYGEEQFHAVLAWDVLDYLDAHVLPHVVRRLHSVLRPNGVLLGIFHNRPPERCHRYRVVDAQTIELLPATSSLGPQRALQNRELLNLFSAFRSSKTYVARDQLREALFTK